MLGDDYELKGGGAPMTLAGAGIPPLANPRHRLGALAVDTGLSFVTLGIGWLVWSCVVWSRGQTPGKRLLKIRVLNESNGKPASWGQMLIRQVLINVALAMPIYLCELLYFLKPSSRPGIDLTYGAILLVWFALLFALFIVDMVWLFGPKHRRLLDYWSGTVVVNEGASKKYDLLGLQSQ